MDYMVGKKKLAASTKILFGGFLGIVCVFPFLFSTLQQSTWSHEKGSHGPPSLRSSGTNAVYEALSVKHEKRQDPQRKKRNAQTKEEIEEMVEAEAHFAWEGGKEARDAIMAVMDPKQADIISTRQDKPVFVYMDWVLPSER